MKNRKAPETIENLPDFIKVVFDENGHPIDVKSAKGISDFKVALEPNGGSDHAPVVAVPLTVNKGVIEKMLICANSNIEILRKELRQHEYVLQQILQHAKLGDQDKINSMLLDSILPLKQKIENLEKKIELHDEFTQAVNSNLDNLNIYLVDLSKKVNELKNAPGVEEKLDDIDLRISNLVKEIAETKANEIVTVQNLNSILEKISDLSDEVQNQKIFGSAFVEKVNDIENDVMTINGNIFQENIQTRAILSDVTDKLEKFSSLGEKIDSVTENINRSISKLADNQNDLKDLLIDQEKITRAVSYETLSKIQKMLNKPKKRVVIKPTRSKVIRFLKKNFKIKPFSKILVIADKRNLTFGKTLSEAARTISEKSVFAVTESRTNKTTFAKHVVGAIKQSNFVFIVGNYNSKQMKKIRKPLKPNVKIFSIKRTLNYSNLKSK